MHFTLKRKKYRGTMNNSPASTDQRMKTAATAELQSSSDCRGHALWRPALRKVHTARVSLTDRGRYNCWDDQYDAASAFKPAFMHKPVEIDLPRIRSSLFSLPEDRREMQQIEGTTKIASTFLLLAALRNHLGHDTTLHCPCAPKLMEKIRVEMLHDA